MVEPDDEGLDDAVRGLQLGKHKKNIAGEAGFVTTPPPLYFWFVFLSMSLKGSEKYFLGADTEYFHRGGPEFERKKCV